MNDKKQQNLDRAERFIKSHLEKKLQNEIIKPIMKNKRKVVEKRLDEAEMLRISRGIAATGMLTDALIKKKFKAKIPRSNFSVEYENNDAEEKVGVFFKKGF
jgi:hypothetical protein